MPNLDAALTLINSANVVVATANPLHSLYPVLTASVSAGIYYLRIAGVGEGDPLQTGYSNYGSLGDYEIAGTIIRPSASTPTGVQASDNLADRVLVSWIAADGAAGYNIYRATSNNTAAATKLNSSPVTTTSFSDTTATPGTAYFYWVRSKGTTGESDFGIPDGGIRVVGATRTLGFAGSLAFGALPINTSKTASLTLSNTGNSTLTVSHINFPSGEFTGDASAFSLAPGATRKVTVTFAPRAVGSFGGTVIVDANVTGGQSTLPISGSATATNKATVTLGNLAQIYSGAPKSANVLTSPGSLAVSLSYNGSGTAPTNAGSYAVVAKILAPFSGSTSGTMVITKAAQTINFPVLPTTRVGAANFALSASSSSGLAVSFTSSNRAVATVKGTTLTVVGKGSTTITARQAGNGNYNAAPDVTRTLTVEAGAIAPAFKRQPSAVSITSDQTVTFSVAVTGAPVPTLRWQVSMDDGKSFSDLDNDSIYTGVTTTTLSVNASANLNAALYRCVATNDGGTAVSSLAVLSVSVPSPANDLFTNRLVLTGLPVSATGSNLAATKETGEPNHDGSHGGRSVWWRWTAPSSGNVVVSTSGSSFDTVLAVYTGASLAELVRVASDDDSGTHFASQLTFSASAGTTYQIAVDGFGGSSGTIALSLTSADVPAPAGGPAAAGSVVAGTGSPRSVLAPGSVPAELRGDRAPTTDELSYLFNKNLAQFTVSTADAIAWVSALGLDSTTPPPTAADLSPLLALAMNLDASSPSSLLPTAAVTVTADGTAALTLRYRERKNLAALGLRLAVQSSTDNVNWTDLPPSAITPLSDDDVSTARFTASVPLPADGGVFMLRLVLAVAPGSLGAEPAP